jgi:CsoR family transcriptional regulator, copper-sensing transcriptional repressor
MPIRAAYSPLGGVSVLPVRALIYPDYPILPKCESLSATSKSKEWKTMSLELPAKRHTALDHLHAVRGQLDEVTRMLESDAYCVDVMKQVKTVQSLLDSVHRATMHKHLETCFVEAVVHGREQAAIDELVDAVQLTTTVTAQLEPAAIASGAASNTRQLLGATTLSLPGISSQRCKSALEGILTAIAGVGAVEVEVPTKTVVIYHDHRVSGRQLIEAMEEQGYHGTNALVTTEGRTGSLDLRSDRRGIEDRERAPGLTTTASRLAPQVPEGIQATLGFLDGDGI